MAAAIGGAPGWIAALVRAPGAEGGWTGVLDYVCEVSAILGSSLFAASLVLMLRTSRLERLFGGLSNLYFSHHATGAAAFIVLLLHPVALGLARLAGGDAELALSATLPSPAQPAVLAGWIALLWLMAMMAGTFHMRLSYVTWRWLHASAGLAFGIALVHVVAVRPRFDLPEALLAIWATAALAALGWRLLIDRAKVGSYRHLVSGVERRSSDVVEVHLRPIGPPLRFSPGQFVLAAFYDHQDYRGCAEFHPFTIASAPGETDLRIVVKALGDCTARMQSLHPGVLARVQGPFGSFAQQVPAWREQIWIAGGIGVTPFVSMARGLAPVGPPVVLFYAAATAGDAVCLPEIESAADHSPRLRVVTLFADRGEILTAERIAAESGPLAGKEFLMCGPVEMVQSISAQLAALGVPHEAMHAERFDFR